MYFNGCDSILSRKIHIKCDERNKNEKKIVAATTETYKTPTTRNKSNKTKSRKT